MYIINQITKCILDLKAKALIYICDTSSSSCGLSDPEGIIHPLLNVSTHFTWFIRYIYYWNLQFLNNVIIIDTIGQPPSGNISRFCLS
jgi:hypothetical protein